MEINFYNQGQSLIGIIIVLVVVGVISGGLYLYLQNQKLEIPKITEKADEEEITKPKREIPSSEEELSEGEIILEKDIIPEEKIKEEPSLKKLDSPTFSLPGGTYNNFQTAKINLSIKGAQIFYTLDGTEPSIYSFQYSKPLEIRKAGTTKVKAIAIKDGYQNSSVATAVYTIDYGDSALGEIGGLHYSWWDFGTTNFKNLYINITIYDEPDNNDGLYFQMYQGTINGVGFYFGLQTDVYNQNTGSSGKGLIFSRWETRDLSNVNTVQGGWSQSAGYEGNFVGIRKNYEWTNHSYQLKISYTESDGVGDWYGVWIYDFNNSTGDYLGSIRFPSVESGDSGIANGAVTWTELYSKEIKETPIPTWHVSIDKIYSIINGNKTNAVSASSAYSKINNTDIYYDSATKKIHFIMGSNVNREHDAGKLY